MVTDVKWQLSTKEIDTRKLQFNLFSFDFLFTGMNRIYFLSIYRANFLSGSENQHALFRNVG